MMTEDEMRHILDENQRLIETHCWIGRNPSRPWLPEKLVQSELVDRYHYEMLTEAQIDWLINDFTGRGKIGEMMLDLLSRSRHPKAVAWFFSPEGEAIMDSAHGDQVLMWDLLGGYPEPKA
jgi:hypothetical protein